MPTTIQLTAETNARRELVIRVPQEVSANTTRIVLEVSPPAQPQHPTLSDLLSSEFFGMWRDRDDITDSADYARELRKRAWSRQGSLSVAAAAPARHSGNSIL